MAVSKLVGVVLVLFVAKAHAWSIGKASDNILSRREAIFAQVLTAGGVLLNNNVAPAFAEEAVATAGVEVVAVGDAMKLFQEGRAREGQGNMEAAQRLYQKVTKISPSFIYGWSNLGNTQVALGYLDPAEESYSTAIGLCQENLKETEDAFGVRRCDDLYILLLNRGCLRMNNGLIKEALKDLSRASELRGKPDGVIAQNLARARELNGMYASADREYTMAISMTSNEVNPFWLRSALVKLQLGDVKGGFDLFKRIAVRFPDAPEVKAAYAVFLAETGEQIAAQQKYLEMPDIQRLKFVNDDYLGKTIAWPPAAIEALAKVTSVVEKPKQTLRSESE